MPCLQVTTLQGIERYMKQAIVDRNAAVSSAALVSSLHLSKIAGDVMKRWVNEVQEAVNSDRYICMLKDFGVFTVQCKTKEFGSLFLFFNFSK
jgi:coatomer protein complex subunit gamma